MINSAGGLLRRCAVVLLAVTLTAAPAVLVPSSAAAAEPDAPAFQVDWYGGATSRTYGSAEDAGKRIVISPETTQVMLDPGLEFIGSEVNCGAVGTDSSAIDAYYAAGTDWIADSTPTVAVLPGTVVAGSGAVFRYRCVSAEYEFFSLSDEVVWEFVEGPGAGDTITFGHDDALLVQQTTDTTYTSVVDDGDPVQVPLGGNFVVTGPAGTWGTTDATERDAQLNPVGFEGPTVPATDVAVTADGSALSFALPADGVGDYQDHYGELSARTTTVSTGSSGATLTSTVRWWAYVQFAAPEKAASQIGATLDRLYTASFLHPHLTVTIEATAVPDAAGAVIVTIDGVDRPARAIPAAATTKLTIILPKLARGTHVISARYLGAGNVEPSATGTLRLRVLI